MCATPLCCCAMRRSGLGACFRCRFITQFGTCCSVNRIGKTLQGSQRAAHAMVGFIADARIEQHLQPGLLCHLDDIHDVWPPNSVAKPAEPEFLLEAK